MDFYLTLWAINREREADVLPLRIAAAASAVDADVAALRMAAATSAGDAASASARRVRHGPAPRSLWSLVAAVFRPLLRRHA